jgi:tRNA A37 threonylcarbamoyladenosine modification protein TsaB
MLSLANGSRLVAVPTLDVIAQNALGPAEDDSSSAVPPPARVIALLDAKRGRAFAAPYSRRDDVYVPESGPAEVEPGAFLSDQVERFGPSAVLGEGVLYHRDAVSASGAMVLPENFYFPRPEIVYRLGCRLAAEGRFADRRSLTPVYVRPPEAEEKWMRRQVREPLR